MMNSQSIDSPVGRIHLLASGQGLSALYFHPQISAMERRFPSPHHNGDNPWLARAEEYLRLYFAGEVPRLPAIPLDLRGTPFQLEVWRELQSIAHGRTCSYGQLAERIGRPAAVRAVGAAVGRNPISILVPCHRVVGASGSLTGYAGGLDVKRHLLRLEDPSRTRRAA